MSWCEIIVNIVVSSITGVGASFAIWWLTFKVWAPNINFAKYISRLKTDENPSGYKYRFKFENTGRRNIIDVEVVARLRIKGLRPNFPNNWEVLYLSTSSFDHKKISIVRPSSSHHVRPVFEIKVNDERYFTKSFFPEGIRNLSNKGILTLDDILSIGNEANLQILLLAYDEYSGSRKFFESIILTRYHVKDGSYRMNSVEIDEVLHDQEQIS
jgi:hypothetical protein